jgi:hypothetical protein
MRSPTRDDKSRQSMRSEGKPSWVRTNHKKRGGKSRHARRNA